MGSPTRPLPSYLYLLCGTSPGLDRPHSSSITNDTDGKQVEWAKYDLYCVGLILVRVLFPPLWCGEFFDEFAGRIRHAFTAGETELLMPIEAGSLILCVLPDTYHEANYDLDFWLKRLIMADDELAKQMRTQSEMDGQYVELAKESCALHPGHTLITPPPHPLYPVNWLCCARFNSQPGVKHKLKTVISEGARLNMCSIQEGLEVLNLKGRGICWDTLRYSNLEMSQSLIDSLWPSICAFHKS